MTSKRTRPSSSSTAPSPSAASPRSAASPPSSTTSPPPSVLAPTPTLRATTWPAEAARNLRFALRQLRQAPAFAAAAILTLALCIGANTAIFSVVDAVLLRPLPYPHPEELAEVATVVRGAGFEELHTGQTGAAWEVLRDHAAELDRAVFSAGAGGVNLALQGRAEYVQQQRVSAGFFHVLGVQPLVGREFTAAEDRAGGPAVTLLSHGLWRRAFHADPRVVGRTVSLRGEPHVVVGVLPAAFQSDVAVDLWTPLRPSPRGEGDGTNYAVVARLRPGVSWAAAEAQVAGLSGAALAHLHFSPTTTARLHLIPLQRGLADGVRKPLLVLLGAVGVVLLIGCLNVASLLLARNARRTRELCTRIALGSGAAGIVRQLLAESLLLAFLGGIAGVALGYLGIRGLEALARQAVHVPAIHLDARILAVTACASLLTAFLFGLLPALRASRVDVRSALVAGGGWGASGTTRGWSRRALVVAEVALGVVLLIVAGLLLRTFGYLNNLRPGFDPAHVVTATLSLQDARYAGSREVNRLFAASLARIRRLPGVESAAAGLSVPFERWLNVGFKRLDGPPAAGPDGNGGLTDFSYVTPDWFAALRIPLLRGRAFRDADRPDSAQVVIVNRAFARKYLSGQEAVGSHLSFGDAAREVVGVVGDVPQASGWGSFGPLAASPTAFIPAAQVEGDLKVLHTWFSPSWVVRIAGPPTAASRAAVAAGMRQAVEAIDPLLPFAAFRSLDEVKAETLAQQRFQAALLGMLAALALVLAAVGIYGLIANAVAERTRELGIRMALGSTIAQAMTAVALPGILLASAGAAAGCLLARFAVAALRHMVWGVSASDPLTFALVPLGLVLAAAAASFLPALRISRLDPALTLRND
jgi:predicted permease